MRTQSRSKSRTARRSAGQDRLGGRYRLGDRIGRGGMATVYRATDEQLDRLVAVKVMRGELAEDAQFVRRFTGEARRAASVVHPNVVAVYDVGADRRPYMVMELVEGGDLAAHLRREGRLDPAHAARIVAGAADAVAAAHAAGLVHRDVKPGNILIGSDGRAMVADFGIARATGEESMTRTGAALGSVDYFSPEQARGERAGPASDVYALGVVLFEVLTGRRPFDGETPYAIATARLDAPVPDAKDVVPTVPAELAAIAMASMAPEPGDRPRAEELRDQLRAWLEAVDAAIVAAVGPAAATPRSPSRLAVPHGTRPPSVTRAVGGPAEVASVPAAPAANSVIPAAEPRPKRQPVLLLVAVALAGLAGIGFLLGGLMAGDRAGEALPSIIVGSPGGQAFNNPTPSPTLTPTPSLPPTTAPVIAPQSTASMSTVAPGPSQPPPATTPQPTPQPPQPTPAPIAAADPTEAVGAFYANVESGRFDEAYALWSDRMKAEYPRQENLDERFDDTADIRFSAIYVAAQSGSRATVQANFTETYDSGSTRDFVGYWQLVFLDGRWLLDQPTY
jgi:serine/threonine protein kinase